MAETPTVEKKIAKYLKLRIGNRDARKFGAENLDRYIDSRCRDIHPRTQAPSQQRHAEPRDFHHFEKLEVQFAKLMWEQRNPVCPYMFQRNGRPVRDFRAAFKSACARVGIPDQLFHDQRRTAVTNMICNGVPENDAMAVSGHLDRLMLERYTIVKEQGVKRAAEHMSAKFKARRNSGTTAGERSAAEKWWHELWHGKSGSQPDWTAAPGLGRKFDGL